jgi:transcriptional regulator with GAF, ATPase, and Fis domain
LPRLVAQEKFRGDLFFRLNVFPIHLPPLRERGDDIPLLLQFFLKKFSARIGKAVDDVTPEFLRRFQAYSWPGNVRELENLVERAVILTASSTLDVDSIPVLASEGGVVHPQAPRPGARLEAVEREHILATLERARWVIEGPAGAARLLELHPNTLRSRMKKLGITRADRAAKA